MGGAAGRYLTSSLHVCGEAGAGGGGDAVSAVSELEVREWVEEQGAGAEESDGEGAPRFLPTPDFMASAGER